MLSEAWCNGLSSHEDFACVIEVLSIVMCFVLKNVSKRWLCEISTIYEVLGFVHYDLLNVIIYRLFQEISVHFSLYMYEHHCNKWKREGKTVSFTSIPTCLSTTFNNRRLTLELSYEAKAKA